MKRVFPLILVSVSLGGMVTVAVGGIYLGYQLIVNPTSLPWLEQWLPASAHIPDNLPQPQAWSNIQVELQQSGLQSETPIALTSQAGDEAATDLLLPIAKARPNCQTHCTQIVELRIYRPIPSQVNLALEDQAFRLLDQVAIAGPEELFVLAPRNEALETDSGSSRRLPLTEVRSLGGEAPESGIWLTLQGEFKRGGDPILYGQLVHYEPRSAQLSLLTRWTSPSQKRPYWQELSGANPPELIIDQTVALEPDLQAYQLIPAPATQIQWQLKKISFQDAILNRAEYRDGLMLARAGLWSAAQKSLTAVKSSIKESWPDEAEAQLQLINAHAERTKAQADRDWSSPSQQILAELIDGRWSSALQQFERSQATRPEIENSLKADSGRLWDRVSTTLKANPNQPEAKIWGALLLALQRDEAAAFAWLKQQPQTDATLSAQVRQLLASPRLVANTSTTRADPDQPAALGAVVDTGGPTPDTSRIIGAAAPFSTVNLANWRSPLPLQTLQLQNQQVWYQIEVTQFHDGQQWQYSPFAQISTETATQVLQLWRRLGLSTDTQLQITSWQDNNQSQSIAATVQALQVQNGRLRLLATGEPFSSPSSTLRLFATSASALQWTSLPPSEALALVNQTQPDRIAALMPSLWQALKSNQYVLALPAGSIQGTLQQFQSWPVQLLDLTHDQQPETVMSLSPKQLTSLLNATNQTQSVSATSPRTLIFSPTGRLLYSDLAAPQDAVVAIATLGTTNTPTLVIQRGLAYQLLTWSEAAQQFQ